MYNIQQCYVHFHHRLQLTYDRGVCVCARDGVSVGWKSVVDMSHLMRIGQWQAFQLECVLASLLLQYGLHHWYLALVIIKVLHTKPGMHLWWKTGPHPFILFICTNALCLLRHHILHLTASYALEVCEMSKFIVGQHSLLFSVTSCSISGDYQSLWTKICFWHLKH